MGDFPYVIFAYGKPLKSNGKVVRFPDEGSADAYVEMLRRKLADAPYEIERLLDE